LVDAEKTQRSQAHPLSYGPDRVSIHVQAGILGALAEEHPDRRARIQLGDGRRELPFELAPRPREQEHQLGLAWLYKCDRARQAEGLDDARNAIDHGDCRARSYTSLLSHAFLSHRSRLSP